MDAQTLRRFLYDFFKFNPKYFSTQACGTGYLVTPISQKSPTDLFPFKLLDASTADGHKIRVVYGLVGGAAPDGMSPGDVPPYTIDVTGPTGFVYLGVGTDDDYNITSRFIDTAETVPPDNDTLGEGPSEFYCQIGSFSINDDTLTIAQGISGSQGFRWCNGGLFALS
jgi:hypothetical protein